MNLAHFIAYFIGGPADQRKEATNVNPPEWVVQSLDTSVCSYEADPAGPVPINRHLYKRVYTNDNKVIVYMYDRSTKGPRR